MIGPNPSLNAVPLANTASPADGNRWPLAFSIRPAIAALRTRMELRAAQARLHALDQTMLKDIGLDRSEIESVLTDRTGERRVGARSPLPPDPPPSDRQAPDPIRKPVMTVRVLAASALVLAAAVALVAELTPASSDTPRMGAQPLTHGSSSIDSSAITSRAALDLRVESYPLH